MLETGVRWQDARNNINSGAFRLIDLRSEKEFNNGHIPMAQNLPLLNNGERHEIGCLYKQEGKDAAVHRGLSLFAGKAGRFMDSCQNLAENCEGLVLYCWRGGMRSRLVGQWLAAAGFNCLVLEGGYKYFRRTVLKALDSLARHEKLVLNGRTGSGKTLLVKDLIESGYPAIDLEGLARHRGSAFGALAWPEPSPCQQNFENLLADSYLNIQQHPRLVLEIEGVIGPVSLPTPLRDSIRTSPMLYVERDFSDRVSLLTKIYAACWGSAQEEESLNALNMLKKFLSGQDFEALKKDICEGRLQKVVGRLLELRYDRAYDKSLHRHKDQMLTNFNLTHQYQEALSYIHNWLAAGIQETTGDLTI